MIAEFVYEHVKDGPTRERLVQALAADGVAVVHGFFSREELAEIKREWHALHDYRREGFNAFGAYRTGRIMFVARELLALEHFPLIAKTFASPWMGGLADRYLGPNVFNVDVCASHETMADSRISFVHYDKMFGFKFFFYLNDCTRNNGAFQYIPGTHLENRRKSADFLAQGLEVRNWPSDWGREEGPELLDVEAPAGGLIIFDTAGFHGGGVISAGGERMVLRGHCYGKPRPTYHPAAETPQWRIETAKPNEIPAEDVARFYHSYTHPIRLHQSFQP